MNIDFVGGSIVIAVDSGAAKHGLEHLEVLLGACRSRGLNDVRVMACPEGKSPVPVAAALLLRHGVPVVTHESVDTQPAREGLYSTQLGRRACTGSDGPIDYHLRLSDGGVAVARATTAAILIGIASGLDDATRGHLRLCVYELAINTVEHGTFEGGQPEIVLDVRVTDGVVTLSYRDNSAVFMTGNHMHIDVPQKIKEGDKRGLGLFILNKLAATVDYRRLGKWNLTNLTLAVRAGGHHDEQRRSTMEGVTVEVVPCDQPGTVILKPSGSIDSSSTHVIESQIESLIAQGSNRIVIDFSDVSFISSAGVGVFLGTVSRLRSGGGDLIFMNTPTHIQEVFEIINLKSYFMTIESIDDLNTVSPTSE